MPEVPAPTSPAAPPDAGPPGWRTWARRWLAPWLLGIGLLLGPAYPMYVHYDFSHSRDTLTYLSVARGEWVGSSVTRRYRVLVPAAAAAVAWPIKLGYAHLWPTRAAVTDARTDWPLRLAFYLINTLLLGLSGAVLWRTARHAGAPLATAGLAVVAVLTSRWATYTAGLPLVDSLYCLVFALAYYGAAARARWALVAALLLGPLAKESFLLVVPWVLWFGRDTLRWPVQLGLTALSGAAVLAVHYYVDARVGPEATGSMQNAVNHFENITYSLGRLLSVKGMGELFSIFGLFWLVPAWGLWRGRDTWARQVGAAAWALLVPVGVHMLLSGDLARMGYLAAPWFVVAVARIRVKALQTQG